MARRRRTRGARRFSRGARRRTVWYRDHYVVTLDDSPNTDATALVSGYDLQDANPWDSSKSSTMKRIIVKVMIAALGAAANQAFKLFASVILRKGGETVYSPLYTQTQDSIEDLIAQEELSIVPNTTTMTTAEIELDSTSQRKLLADDNITILLHCTTLGGDVAPAAGNSFACSVNYSILLAEPI